MKRFTIILFLFLMTQSAAASLVVSPVLIDFRGSGLETREMKVANTGDRTQYIRTTATRIVNPETEKPTVVSSNNPEEVGLLVSPRELILEPGEERLVRVTKLRSGVREDLVWRVKIEPVVGQVVSENSGVALLVAYNTLVYSRPLDATVQLNSERLEGILVIRNSGTTNAKLVDGKACIFPSSNNCESLPAQRLWSGGEIKIEVDPDREVRYTVEGVGQPVDMAFFPNNR